MPRDPPKLALNTYRDGAPTASLGNQFHCLTTFTANNFFLASDLQLLSFSLRPLPIVPEHAIGFPCFISQNTLMGFPSLFQDPNLGLYAKILIMSLMRSKWQHEGLRGGTGLHVVCCVCGQPAPKPCHLHVPVPPLFCSNRGHAERRAIKSKTFIGTRVLSVEVSHWEPGDFPPPYKQADLEW